MAFRLRHGPFTTRFALRPPFADRPDSLFLRLLRTGWIALAVSFAAISPTALAVDRSIEFRGQVVIPNESVLRGKRITLALLHVGTSFHARTSANFDGKFRFKDIPTGTYSLSIVIPGAGEMRTTVVLTPTFADERGRIEKIFSYDAEALAHDTFPLRQGTVSVRELSLPRKARGEYAAARNELRRQRVESARRHLEKAVEMAPEFLEAYNYLGVLAYQRKEFAAAVGYFRRALDVDPEAYEPLVNLGGALLALGDTESALEINQRAQSIQPQDALANAQLGLSYYMLGNDEEALNYLLLTEQLDPAHFSRPQLTLANIYLSNSEEAAAIDELEEFLRLHPDSPETDEVRATLEKIHLAMEGEDASYDARR